MDKYFNTILGRNIDPKTGKKSESQFVWYLPKGLRKLVEVGDIVRVSPLRVNRFAIVDDLIKVGGNPRTYNGKKVYRKVTGLVMKGGVINE